MPERISIRARLHPVFVSVGESIVAFIDAIDINDSQHQQRNNRQQYLAAHDLVMAGRMQRILRLVDNVLRSV
jgi:hypothetical protein